MKLFQRFPTYKDASKVHRLQVLLFSATLQSPEVKDLAAKICTNPILVDLKVWLLSTRAATSSSIFCCFR